MTNNAIYNYGSCVDISAPVKVVAKRAEKISYGNLSHLLKGGLYSRRVALFENKPPLPVWVISTAEKGGA